MEAMNETEYVDVLNENGEPTGAIMRGAEARANGFWTQVVGVVIVNDRQQILLQLRSPNIGWANLWHVSAGGRVNAGETGLQAAIRETQEEIGLELNESELHKIYSGTYITERHGKPLRYFDTHYIVHKNIDIANLNLQEYEVAAVKWFELRELKKMVAEKDERLTPIWTEWAAIVNFML
ncbi:MAG: NUDIX domain-containing protein [Christensenellaceae bacterium]|jgi:8-oxo-dGTP pyrophosphatase MutT (NUDIX family)|nr:NUDIX domain-containing protein [Christensenellaceae bacterium]